MAQNYQRIGDYIRVIDNRNSDGAITNLMGISIDKCYIPSVANVIGTDLSKYKVIKKGQFACSLMQVSRDQRIPLAMYPSDEPAIMSPAYVMFEVNKPTELLPEYMELWFKRAEFDREASFYAVGGVRGSLAWEDFCAMKLPVPSIDAQRKIVHDYQVITDRIELLQKMNENALSSIQCIRKYWLEDYGPFGGSLPSNWKEVLLPEIADIITGYSYSSDELIDNSSLAMATIKNFGIDGGFRIGGYKSLLVKKNAKSAQYCQLFDTIVAHTDLTQGKIIGNAECILSLGRYSDVIISMDLVKVVPKIEGVSKFLLTAILQDNKFKKHCLQFINGTTVMHLSKDALRQYKLYIPDDLSCFEELNNALEKYYKIISHNLNEIELLSQLAACIK